VGKLVKGVTRAREQFELGSRPGRDKIIEWIPSLGYASITEASMDISYLMTYYNRERPHQHNDGIPPAKAEEKLNLLSGNS